LKAHAALSVVLNANITDANMNPSTKQYLAAVLACVEVERADRESLGFEIGVDELQANGYLAKEYDHEQLQQVLARDYLLQRGLSVLVVDDWNNPFVVYWAWCNMYDKEFHHAPELAPRFLLEAAPSKLLAAHYAQLDWARSMPQGYAPSRDEEMQFLCLLSETKSVLMYAVENLCDAPWLEEAADSIAHMLNHLRDFLFEDEAAEDEAAEVEALGSGRRGSVLVHWVNQNSIVAVCTTAGVAQALAQAAKKQKNTLPTW
jgi:hypothetical protein